MKSVGRMYRKHEGIPSDGPWDAIVIGSGMGGLTAASLLAKHGKKVLLLEQNRIVGGCTQSYERDGYKWTVGMHYVGKGEFTRNLFDGVTDKKVEWQDMPPIYNRFVIDGEEYEVPAGLGSYVEFLKSRFPNEAVAIDGYIELVTSFGRSSRDFFAQKAFPEEATEESYDQVCEPFHQFSDRTTLDVLSGLTDDPKLIAVLCANWGDHGLPPGESSFAMHCMLFQHFVDGAAYPVGGGEAFASTMAPSIEAAGGAVVSNAEVDQVLVRNGRTYGVRLTSGEDIRADIVISNAGVQNTFGRLLEPDVASNFGLRKQLEGIEDAYTVVGANVGLSSSTDEINIQPANLWLHPTSDLDANLKAHQESFEAPFGFVFMTFPSAKDPSWDENFPGKSVVEIHAYTTYEHFEQWAGTSWRKRGNSYEKLKQDIKERLLEHLYAHVPGARGAVDVVEISTPLSYETFLKRERGGFMGIAPSPKRYRQRWLRAPTPIAGLYLTGQDIALDSLTGAMMGGIITASSVLQRDLMTELLEV